MMKQIRLSQLFASVGATLCLGSETLPAHELEPGVRGVATRAPEKMTIDGDLREFENAFCTPVEYHHANLRERAAQFFYMWDETAFYAALRTLDTKLFNGAPNDRLWEGDGVEWYFDTRQDEQFRSQAWPVAAGSGAVHCYWVGLTYDNVAPRFCLRPGFLEVIDKAGVEVGSRKTEHGLEVEFKLPWANFPGFVAEEDVVIALDSELCYSDGAERLFRSFVFGSPLSVQQPASLAKVQLVDSLEADHWANCGPVMFPMRVDTAWGQPSKPRVTGIIALPPGQMDEVGRVVFRLTKLDGAVIAEFPAKRETFEEEGKFTRATASWPADIAAPGNHHVTAIVFDRSWTERARIAPRLVSVNWETGY